MPKLTRLPDSGFLQRFLDDAPSHLDPEVTDALVLRFQQRGCSRSLERLFSLHGRTLGMTARKMRLPVDEIAGEFWMSFTKAVKTYDPSKSRNRRRGFQNWVITKFREDLRHGKFFQGVVSLPYDERCMDDPDHPGRRMRKRLAICEFSDARFTEIPGTEEWQPLPASRRIPE